MALYIHVSVNCKTCTNSIVTSFLASKVAASGVEAAADVDVLSSVCDSSTSALSMNLGSPFISSSQIREVCGDVCKEGGPRQIFRATRVEGL